MQKTILGAAVACALLAACAGGGVTVRKTGVTAPAKPAGCALEVLNKRPSRAYDALGELSSHLTRIPAEGPVSVLLPKACELGADALVVDRNLVLNEVGHVLVVGTAIRWRADAGPAAPEAPATPPTPAPIAPEAPAAPSVPPASEGRPETTPRY